MHNNLILSYNELNTIQDSLREIGEMRTDGDSINELREKIAKQRDAGNTAKDYPFWRNYFGDEKV